MRHTRGSHSDDFADTEPCYCDQTAAPSPPAPSAPDSSILDRNCRAEEPYLYAPAPSGGLTRAKVAELVSKIWNYGIVTSVGPSEWRSGVAKLIESALAAERKVVIETVLRMERQFRIDFEVSRTSNLRLPATQPTVESVEAELERARGAK